MQIDGKLKHYKGFYQLSCDKLKAIKSRRRSSSYSFTCNYVTAQRTGGAGLGGGTFS